MGIWMMPSMSYSTGSSVVISLSSIEFSSFNAPYNVVVLPQPVGPSPACNAIGLADDLAERMKNPLGHAHDVQIEHDHAERSRIRMTTLSPNMVGSTATRRSTG